MSQVEREVTVSAEELPICCPPKEEKAWSLHPRVYLKPDSDGVAICPYCSTRYHVHKS